MGDSGCGKTYSLRTLPLAGITPFVIFLEPSVEVLGELPRGSFHYLYLSPQISHPWAQALNMAEKINSLSYENLTKISDPNKQAHNKFLDLLRACNNFVCSCCGTSWGDVSTWGTDRALCIDGLSGISDMAMSLVVGNKPVRSMPDWGVAQNTVKMFLLPLVNSVSATVVLIAHLARERDEVTGGTTIMVNTLGQKLAPDIPRMFSEVIQSVRLGDKFFWDTAGANITVKTRNLPIAANQPPSFVPLIEAWKRKGGVITPSPQPAT